MVIATDPLSLVFIACFLFGLLFMVATALLGNLGHGHAHIGGHAASHHIGAHIGGSHAAGHAGGTHAGGQAASTHGAAHSTGHAAGTQHAANQQAQGQIQSVLAYLNPTTIVFFLLGFGFFGYLFHTTTPLILPLLLTFSAVGGLVIAGLLLLLLSRVFGDSEGATVQDVSDRTGLLGKVSITIQEKGLGEIIYISPGGMRKSIAARSVDGRRLERDQEVVVVNYKNGVAEVDTWERFINDGDEAAQVEAPASTKDELAELRALLEESDKEDTKLVMRNDVQKE